MNPRILSLSALAVTAAVAAGCSADAEDERSTQESETAELRGHECRKVAICHHGRDRSMTLYVAERAVQAHLQHGDSLGECAMGCASDPASCDDSNLCTADQCLPDGTCVHASVTCDDGNRCTGDRCDPTVGCLNDPVECPAADACHVGFCDPETGACGSAPVSCDDLNPCTAERCDPAVGCLVTNTDGIPCEACTNEPCTTGVCQGGMCGNLTLSCTAQPNDGRAPLTVNFGAVASGGTGQYQFHWVFGEPGAPSSAERNPTFTYRLGPTQGDFVQYAAVVRAMSPAGQDPENPRPGTFADCRRVITVR
jgi:hypothetical protein